MIRLFAVKPVVIIGANKKNKEFYEKKVFKGPGAESIFFN